MRRDVCEDALAEMFLEEADAATTSFLWRELGLRRGSRVFDQGCGTGRLALALAAQGARVFGLDLSADYLRRAERRAREAGADCRFLRGDAARVSPPGRFDAALSWYSSFGWSRGEEDDVRALRRVFRALKPGGRFVLDWPNLASVLREFRPSRSWRKRIPGGILEVRRECALDLRAGLIRQKWSCRRPGGSRGALSAALRLYLPHQLSGLLVECGFTRVRLLGGVDGGPLGSESRRCIVTARRPG